ncbi:MAG: hypothetical protein E7620_08555 [Ruminococcaceae bacterium]|nr:hypothetical protein [Oscillospiraceae bacterium]
MKKAAAALLAAGITLSVGFTSSAVSETSGVFAKAPQRTVVSTVTSATILSDCVAALGSGSYGGENEYLTYAYYYGTPENLRPYQKFNNDNGGSGDRLNGSSTLVNRWLSQSINGESTIIKVTAKSNLTLILTSESDASHKYICWSPDSYFEYIAEGAATNGTIYRISLDRRFALVDAPANAYAAEVTMQAGDSFLFVFGSDFKTAKSASRWIHFSVSTDYDPASRPNFDAMPALTAKRLERINALTALANAVSQENGYSRESEAAACAALADAPRRMERTRTEADVEAVFQSIAGSIEAAKRLTLREDELSTAVQETCARLDALMASVDQVKYAAVYDRVEALYYEALEQTYAATNPTSARYQYNRYQPYIYALLNACEQGGQA